MTDTTTAAAVLDRPLEGPALLAPPPHRRNGHEFEYESINDLFRCDFCRAYEAQALTDGQYSPCPGLVSWGGDTERAYLLATFHPVAAEHWLSWLCGRIRGTELGRTRRFAYRAGRLLVESVPAMVDELAATMAGWEVGRSAATAPAFMAVEQVTGEQAGEILAVNYTAYVAKYGLPDDQGGTSGDMQAQRYFERQEAARAATGDTADEP
jgi:hypothetical protein